MKAFLQNQHPLTILMAICLALSALAVGLAFRGQDPMSCDGWWNPFDPPQPTLADTALLLRAERHDAAFLERASFVKAIGADEITVLTRGTLTPAELWGDRPSEGVKTVRNRAGKLFYVYERGEPGDFYLCHSHPRKALEQALRDAATPDAPAFALQAVARAADIDLLEGKAKWYLLFDTVWFTLLLAGCWLILRHRHFLLWLPFYTLWTTVMVFLLSFYPSVAAPTDLFYRRLLAEPVLLLWSPYIAGGGMILLFVSLSAYMLLNFLRRRRRSD